VEVYRLADVVNMLVERQLTFNDHTQTLNTVGCRGCRMSLLLFQDYSPVQEASIGFSGPFKLRIVIPLP